LCGSPQERDWAFTCGGETLGRVQQKEAADHEGENVLLTKKKILPSLTLGKKGQGANARRVIRPSPKTGRAHSVLEKRGPIRSQGVWAGKKCTSPSSVTEKGDRRGESGKGKKEEELPAPSEGRGPLVARSR